LALTVLARGVVRAARAAIAADALDSADEIAVAEAVPLVTVAMAADHAAVAVAEAARICRTVVGLEQATGPPTAHVGSASY
jgi:hypothetical protein